MDMRVDSTSIGARVVTLSLTFAVAYCVCLSASGQVQLTKENSVVNIVTNSSAGMNSWTIDGSGSK
jgi:hypothetical protein